MHQGERSTDEYRESFAIVAEQTARLSRLVDDMFLLSRAEANGVFLRSEFVELDEIVADSVRALRVLAQQRGVTVTLGGSQEVGLTGDAVLLHRLMTNLLDNAIRHAAVGGAVTADVQHIEGYAVLRIMNDGPAIAPADRGRIFERFVSGGHSDGAGLGLPIARWIAAAHHGSVELESSEDDRTTFAVRLPINPSRLDPTPPRPGRDRRPVNDVSGLIRKLCLSPTRAKPQEGGAAPGARYWPGPAAVKMWLQTCVPFASSSVVRPRRARNTRSGPDRHGEPGPGRVDGRSECDRVRVHVPRHRVARGDADRRPEHDVACPMLLSRDP